MTQDNKGQPQQGGDGNKSGQQQQKPATPAPQTQPPNEKKAQDTAAS